MMTERKRNILFWVFKVLSIVVSCALPIWGICDKFPLWTEEHGTGRTIGFGAILVIMVVLIIFRKSVFDFIMHRFKLRHAPPLAIWLVILAISYLLVFLGEVMSDITTIVWMGLIGCAIGTVLTFISERFNKKKDVTSDE